MLLSSSPPVYNTHHSLVDLGPYSSLPNNRLMGVTERLNDFNYRLTRSCLTDRDPRAHHHKKRVLFADDCGFKLTQVKYLTEPSDSPPNWSDDFVARITQNIRLPPSRPSPPEQDWRPSFPQPASNYMEFRTKLESNCVALENVIVKNGGSTLSGTVKVKNLCFHKDVSLRVTCDKWKSQQNVPATFSSSGQDHLPNLFDTFAFEYQIPPEALHAKQIEFCVAFRCNGQEYWDNNGGENYKVVLHEKPPEKPEPRTQSQREDKYVDILHEEIHSPWSEFAIWNELISDRPYW